MLKKAIVLGVALGGISALEVRKRLHHRNANWLRNGQGVGPAHHPGTHRGEARVSRKGPEESSATVAGRVNGGGVGSSL